MDRSSRTPPRATPRPEADQLASQVVRLGPAEAADHLERFDDDLVAEVLQRINPSVAGDIIPELEPDRRSSVFTHAPHAVTLSVAGGVSPRPPVLHAAVEPMASPAEQPDGQRRRPPEGEEPRRDHQPPGPHPGAAMGPGGVSRGRRQRQGDRNTSGQRRGEQDGAH